MANYADGKWHAATLGQFIGQMVDSGDDAVVFKLAAETEPNELNCVSQRWDVVLVARGDVTETITEYGCESIHKSLAALIQAGIVR